MNTATGSSITYTTGLILDTKLGERPAPTPRELISTRAVQTKDGWLGQIVMSGEIVYESLPQDEPTEALGVVNQRIHDRLKNLIAGE